MAMTSATIHRLGWNSAARTMARRSAGKGGISGAAIAAATTMTMTTRPKTASGRRTSRATTLAERVDEPGVIVGVSGAGASVMVERPEKAARDAIPACR